MSFCHPVSEEMEMERTVLSVSTPAPPADDATEKFWACISYSFVAVEGGRGSSCDTPLRIKASDRCFSGDVRCSVLQRVAGRCSVLQCVAVCCSALQCVAVCCSLLQCVAVCCSVLQ